MHLSKKWAALAIAHLAVLTCLAAGVILIALRLGAHPELNATLVPEPPTDAEIARWNLQSARIDVIQNNLANADTVAFKRQRVNVEDGTPPRISSCQLDMTQGPLESTGQSLDLAIQGDGFFHIKVRPTLGDGTAYTRNGMLQRDHNGNLIVAIGEGYSLIPPICIPPGATNISVDQTGVVQYQRPGGSAVSVAGQIHLSHFLNPQALNKTDGLYLETPDSGPPQFDNAGDNGVGVLLQGYLEKSNVDPQKEWAALLRAEKLLQLGNPFLSPCTKKQPPHPSEPA